MGSKNEKQAVPVFQEFVTGWEHLCVIKATDLFHLGNETSYTQVNRTLIERRSALGKKSSGVNQPGQT